MALVSVGYIFKAFINKGGLAIIKLFKAAEAGVVDNIKKVNGYNLKQ